MEIQDETLLEAECPNCRSLRAISPDEIDPIKCYVCDTLLNRTNARLPRQPALERIDNTVSTRKVIALAVICVVLVGAVGIAFIRHRRTQAAIAEAARLETIQEGDNLVAFSQLIDRATAPILMANTRDSSWGFGSISYPWVDRCRTVCGTINNEPDLLDLGALCSPEVHISKTESRELDPYVRSGAFRNFRSVVVKVFRLDSINANYRVMGRYFEIGNYSFDIWVLDLKTNNITAHATFSTEPVTGYFVSVSNLERRRGLITTARLWLNNLPVSP
jgi:hypothetical protein